MLRRWMGAAAVLALAIAAGASQAAEPVRIGFSIAQTGLFAAAAPSQLNAYELWKEQVNAAGTGVKEVRAILDAAKERLGHSGQRTVLFIDEIHRFNRAQQDILLGDVEAGTSCWSARRRRIHSSR